MNSVKEKGAALYRTCRLNYELHKWLSATADYSFDRGFGFFNRVRPKGYQSERETYIGWSVIQIFSMSTLGQTFTGICECLQTIGYCAGQG